MPHVVTAKANWYAAPENEGHALVRRVLLPFLVAYSYSSLLLGPGSRFDSSVSVDTVSAGVLPVFVACSLRPPLTPTRVSPCSCEPCCTEPCGCQLEARESSSEICNWVQVRPPIGPVAYHHLHVGDGVHQVLVSSELEPMAPTLLSMAESGPLAAV